MSIDRTYIDTVFDFSGMLGMHSRCGIKVVRKGDKHIFVVTELFEENPGTSITDACARLANRLLSEHGLTPDQLVYIEHCPDRGSALQHYQETFDLVTFEWDGAKLTNPDWKRITREQADEMLRCKLSDPGD